MMDIQMSETKAEAAAMRFAQIIGTEIDSLRAENARLESQVAAERYRPMGDNHHNAIACPYCNPKRFTLEQVERAAELESQVAALREAAQEAWFDWADGLDEGDPFPADHPMMVIRDLTTDECVVCVGVGEINGGHCEICHGFGRVRAQIDAALAQNPSPVGSGGEEGR